jgi:hypothetical protein
MIEHLKRHYPKEEEFLSEFYDVASIAGKLLDGAWEPNPDCNDTTRKNQEYFYSTGELHILVFDSASVYHDANGFSSVQILLKSSNRFVNVRVKNVNDKLVGEILTDRPND